MTTPIDRPFLLLAGVRKCGTTALFRTLQRHPEIVPSRIKEPQFFALASPIVLEHLAWYEDLYAETDTGGGIWMDGSALAFTSPTAPDLVTQVFPSAKVILLIRDPAKRVFSSYTHMARQVRRLGERRSFASVLELLEGASSLDELVARERAAIVAAAEQGALNGSYYAPSFHRDRYDAPFDTDLVDPLASYRYVEESCYSRILPRWEDALRENLKIVVFERLVANPRPVLEDICDFLEIDSGATDLRLEKENVGRLPKNPTVRRLLELRSQNPIARKGVELLKRVGLNRLVEMSRQHLLWGSKPGLDFSTQVRIRKLLEPEYTYWFERDPGLRTLWDISDGQSASFRFPKSDQRSE